MTRNEIEEKAGQVLSELQFSSSSVARDKEQLAAAMKECFDAGARMAYEDAAKCVGITTGVVSKKMLYAKAAALSPSRGEKKWKPDWECHKHKTFGPSYLRCSLCERAR